MITTDNN